MFAEPCHVCTTIIKNHLCSVHKIFTTTRIKKNIYIQLFQLFAGGSFIHVNEDI